MMRKLTTMLITIVLVIATMAVPAYAYDNSVTIFVNGREVEGVEAFMDGNDVIWVSDSYVAVRKLFPKETADLYFPDLVEDRQLQDMANAFGYSMQVKDLNAYLTKGDASDNEGDDTGKPDDEYKAVTIYVENKKVSNVSAYLDEDGYVWLEDGYSALEKIFPDETKDEEFPNLVRDLLLEDFAKEYGYELSLKGSKVYLSKEVIQKEVTIYVDRAKVSNVSAYLDEDGDVWLEDGYSALEKIFPDETKDEKFPNLVRDLLLEDFAEEYGYEFSLEGTKVYLTKRDTAEDVIIYVEGKKISNVNAYIDQDGDIWLENGYTALKKIFPDETKNEKFPNVTKTLLLKDYADDYNYYIQLKGTKVYLTKENQNPEVDSKVKVYVNDMRINVEAELNQFGMAVFDPKDIYAIFPEAKDVVLAEGINYSTSLKDWAEYFKYQYIQKGIRVYLIKNWQSPLEIHCQGKIVDFPDLQPFVSNNRTMIPVRMVAEMLGCNVVWKGTTVEIVGQGKTIVLYLNSKVYTVNGVEYAMDTPTTIVKDRTVVPIRFIAEAFEYEVEYHGEEAVKVVTIEKS